MLTVLTVISLVLAAVYVLVLAVTLITVAVYLLRAGRLATQLVAGLQAVDEQTARLPEYLKTINAALGELRTGLLSVDGHLVSVAGAAGLEPSTAQCALASRE